MRAYSTFSTHDFVLDEFFQHWILNPEDQEANIFWESWLKEHPEKEQIVAEAREVLKSMRFSSYKLDKEGVSALWENIRESRTSVKEHEHLKQKRTVWYSVAAAFIILCLAGIYWLAHDPVLEYTTAYGETKQIVLPDSSVVVLNANSTLRLQKDWEQKPAREIWVDGEAFFTVVHKTNNQPFKVYMGEDVTVEVLGTVFNVYNRHEETKVVLNSGKIQLQLPSGDLQDKIMMEPGEMVEYRARQYIRHKVDPMRYSAWTMNRLELNHTSLEDMVQMVRDNYGLQIEVSDKELLKQTVSGSMPYGDANSLLQQIAKAFQLTIRREGDVFLFEEKY